MKPARWWLIVALCGAGNAQERRPAPELKVRAGVSWFLDEDFPAHFTTGASVRAYLTERFSVEPEFLHFRGDSERSYLFLPNVAYDLNSSTYLIGGLGLFRSTTVLPGGTGFTLNDLGFLGGAGVRIGVSRRFFVFPELRIGIEPNFYLALTAGFGFRLEARRR